MTWQTTSTGQDKDRGDHSTVVWNDYNITAQSLSFGVVAPDSEILVGNIKTLAFDGVNRAEEVFGSVEILHGFKEGSDFLRPHIHFATSDTSIGDVKWQLEYTIAYVDSTYSTPVIISAIKTTNGIDREHLAVEFDTIDATGILIGTQIHFRLFRDANDAQDTYGSDVFLSSLGLHVEIEGDGSKFPFSKQ